MRLDGRVRRFANRVAAALAGVTLLFVQAPAAAQAPAPASARAAAAPRPAIWLIEDSDTRIYLFGTTHMFERGLAWRSARLDAVIREADELVTEIGEGEGEAIADESMWDWLFMTKSVPILSRVSAPYRPRLQRMIDASGLGPETWDQLHTWAAAVMVMATQMTVDMTEEQRAAADPFAAMMSGAEVELHEEFRRAGKPVSAVESAEFQMNLLRGLPPPAQRAFLETTLDDIERAADPDAPGGDAAWLSGNVESVAREMETLPPALYGPLLTERNRAWTEWLVRRLERPGTVLFAVGAGHLAGRDSVPTMLAERGLRARRID